MYTHIYTHIHTYIHTYMCARMCVKDLMVTDKLKQLAACIFLI